MNQSAARIAVAGAGLIGLRHIAAILATPRARLAAIVDPSDNAADIAVQHGVPHYRDLDDLIAAGGVDGVILATPNQLHVAGAMACIAACLPVLIEKPLATQTTSARNMVEAAEAAGVPTLTGHHRRHNPMIAAAHRLISSGEIGTPVSVNGMFWLAKSDDYFATPWRRAPGAGPVFLNLIHDIDLMRHLVGEITAVQAIERSHIRGNPVEETAVILLEFANGALGTLNVSDTIPAPWSWELTAGENPDYPQIDQACYTIGGTQGALELPRLRLWHYQGEQSWWQPISARIAPHAHGDPLVLQIENFAAVIQGRANPLVSGREGLQTLAVIEAIKSAATSRTSVAVPQ